MATLTISDLADRTGLSPATLRAWESRHGFPQPARLPGGHRRYEVDTVALLDEVVRRREQGVRLDVAIAGAVDDLRRRAEPPARSIYAELRRLHPRLTVQRMRKPTLLALSWAIEDEFCSRATRPIVLGAFQREKYWEAATDRWNEIARVAATTIAMADFPGLDGPDDHVAGRPARIPLAEDSPVRREWAVICDSVELPVALTAWELPGQSGVPQAQRVFESVWTLDPAAVRDAARAAASVAAESSAAGAAALYALADAPPPGTTDLASVTEVFGRVLAYVDRYAVG